MCDGAAAAAGGGGAGGGGAGGGGELQTSVIQLASCVCTPFHWIPITNKTKMLLLVKIGRVTNCEPEDMIGPLESGFLAIVDVRYGHVPRQKLVVIFLKHLDRRKLSTSSHF